MARVQMLEDFVIEDNGIKKILPKKKSGQVIGVGIISTRVRFKVYGTRCIETWIPNDKIEIEKGLQNEA